MSFLTECKQDAYSQLKEEAKNNGDLILLKKLEKREKNENL